MTDPTNLALEIHRALATAYGGYSQFGRKEMANALIGHANNGKLSFATPEEGQATLRALAELDDARWEPKVSIQFRIEGAVNDDLHKRVESGLWTTTSADVVSKRLLGEPFDA